MHLTSEQWRSVGRVKNLVFKLTEAEDLDLI